MRRDQRRRLEIVASTMLLGSAYGTASLAVIAPLSAAWPAPFPVGWLAPLAGLVLGLIWGLRIR
jgi:hypothetical protein